MADGLFRSHKVTDKPEEAKQIEDQLDQEQDDFFRQGVLPPSVDPGRVTEDPSTTVPNLQKKKVSKDKADEQRQEDIASGKDEDQQKKGGTSTVEPPRRPRTPSESRLQLNHLVFSVPPEQINIQHEIKNISMGVLRAANTQKVRTGHGFIQVSFPLVFVGPSAINTELVQLLYMLRRTPYCWVENEYLRKTLMPKNKKDAMMLTLQSITVQSVPDLPTTFQAVLQFLWFNYKPYINGIRYRKFYKWNEKMYPTAFGPELGTPGARIPEFGQLREGEQVFMPEGGMLLYGSQVDQEPDKDIQVVEYDYAQEPVSDPRDSESWNAFIRGYTKNTLDKKTEIGPDVASNKYFSMGWKEYRHFDDKSKPADNSEWGLEDASYRIYSRMRHFYASPDFLPVHVSIQFAHRVAVLPLLSQRLPTHQYIGPTDRAVTIVFHATPVGKKILETFSKEIEDFEQQVVDYRQIAKNNYMEIRNPLVKAAGFTKGNFGHQVVPQVIDIETTPGNPGSSIVRVTFSEFNPSVFEEQETPEEREEKIIKTFVESLFHRLSGGRPRDIIYPFSDRLLVTPVGEAAIQQNLNELEAGIEIRMSLTKQQAEKKGQLSLWEVANEIIQLSQDSPTTFAYATDDETYGLKSLSEMSLYWSGEVAYNEKELDRLSTRTGRLKLAIRKIVKRALLYDLAHEFPVLALEFWRVNRDVQACYPDMDLPPHPVTGRVTDTEPDFYLINEELISESDADAQNFCLKQIMPAVDKLCQDDAQTGLDEDEEMTKIVEPESRVYRPAGETNVDNFPGIDKKKYAVEGTITPQEYQYLPGEALVGNITKDYIFKAGVSSIRRHSTLGMRKAFPTFRCYFVKEGYNKFSYKNFYEARGGFAIKGFTVVRSRKIPADMLMIDMINIDGFIETDDLNDIRAEELRSKQTRFTADNKEQFYAYDALIRSQLQINNGLFSTYSGGKFGYNRDYTEEPKTLVDFSTVKKIMKFVSADPTAGEYGPLGTTIEHGNLVDGKYYTKDQLSDPATSIRIGTFLMCKYAFQLSDLGNQPRMNEVVAAMYKYPKFQKDILRAAKEDAEKNNGIITSFWNKRVRHSEFIKFTSSLRNQESAEASVNRQILDKEIKSLRDNVKTISDDLYVAKNSPTSPERRKYIAEREKELAEAKARLLEAQREREEGWVREPVTKGVIFKEGTNVVLKLGYSNDPEKLEAVFAGHVTEVQAGPGTLTLVCQSFATELMQEVKGLENNDMVLKKDPYPNRIANWIISFPEVRHFGRWKDDYRIVEDPSNIRGDKFWRTWNYFNNPSDDNIYVEGDDRSFWAKFRFKTQPFSLNRRTLWQGIQDLALMHPGYVFGVRPYLDLDPSDRRRWRNTLFIGPPDMSYMWRVPDDWNKLKERLELAQAPLQMMQTMNRWGLLTTSHLHQDIEDPATIERWTHTSAADWRKFKDEYAQALQWRREPFRRYHILTSHNDIIDNAIILTKREVKNGIKMVQYDYASKANEEVDKDDTDIIERKLDGMDEQHVKWMFVDNDNAIQDRAQRMATSLLLYSLRDIYDGEITLLGNPRIQPHDICLIYDPYNDMHGPIEVQQVVHTFSEDTGFITQVVPDLVTAVGETAQRTALGALHAYGYATSLRLSGYKPGWKDPAITKALNSTKWQWDTAIITGLGALTYFFPFHMAPILIGGYFLGAWLKDHAIIRIIPLMHKGYPFVTSVEGFRAPESYNVLLNQFQILRRHFRESVDATGALFDDVLQGHGGDIIRFYRNQ